MSNLSERDARTLSTHIVEELREMGQPVTQFRINLDRSGFWFMAEINGRMVWARTGEGNFTYRSVASEIAAAALKASEDAHIHVA